jgi:hypothetical protein
MVADNYVKAAVYLNVLICMVGDYILHWSFLEVGVANWKRGCGLLIIGCHPHWWPVPACMKLHTGLYNYRSGCGGVYNSPICMAHLPHSTLELPSPSLLTLKFPHFISASALQTLIWKSAWAPHSLNVGKTRAKGYIATSQFYLVSFSHNRWEVFKYWAALPCLDWWRPEPVKHIITWQWKAVVTAKEVTVTWLHCQLLLSNAFWLEKDRGS